jgi:hypothetical protein
VRSALIVIGALQHPGGHSLSHQTCGHADEKVHCGADHRERAQAFAFAAIGGLVFDHAVRGTERGTRGDVEIQEAITNVFAECFSTDNQFGITVAAVLPCVLNEVLSAFLATLDNYTLASAALKPKDFRGVLQVDG